MSQCGNTTLAPNLSCFESIYFNSLQSVAHKVMSTPRLPGMAQAKEPPQLQPKWTGGQKYDATTSRVLQGTEKLGNPVTGYVDSYNCSNS